MGTPIISIIVITVFINLSFSPTLYAGSAIYKHVDEDGRVTFTNRSVKGGQKVQSASQAPHSRAKTSNTPNHFPKVSQSTQKKREIKRREILEYELASEMKLFSDTRRDLSLIRSDAESHQQKEKIKQLQSKLTRHQNNIAAIKKELEKL